VVEKLVLLKFVAFSIDKLTLMKQILFIFIALFIYTSTNAQNEKRTRLAFVLSPQLSWLNSDNSEVSSNGNQFGFNFGIEMDRFFEKNYAITTGLTINSTGGKLSYNLPPVEGETVSTIENTTYKLKYLEVPFSLKLLTNEFHRSRYYGQFGIFGQFNIKAADQNGNSLSSEVNFFDMGYHLGGGMEYSLGGDTHLKIGILFNNGFLDVTDHSIIKDKTHLNRFVFQFGVIF